MNLKWLRDSGSGNAFKSQEFFEMLKASVYSKPISTSFQNYPVFLNYLSVSSCRKKGQTFQQVVNIYRGQLYKNCFAPSLLQTLSILFYYFHRQVYFVLMLNHRWASFEMYGSVIRDKIWLKKDMRQIVCSKCTKCWEKLLWSFDRLDLSLSKLTF